MDVRCFVCGEMLDVDEQAYAVVLKLKNVTEEFVREHDGRVYDEFICQHARCWIRVGRFYHYQIDYAYVMHELEERTYHPAPTKK